MHPQIPVTFEEAVSVGLGQNSVEQEISAGPRGNSQLARQRIRIEEYRDQKRTENRSVGRHAWRDYRRPLRDPGEYEQYDSRGDAERSAHDAGIVTVSTGLGAVLPRNQTCGALHERESQACQHRRATRLTSKIVAHESEETEFCSPSRSRLAVVPLRQPSADIVSLGDEFVRTPRSPCRNPFRAPRKTNAPVPPCPHVGSSACRRSSMNIQPSLLEFGRLGWETTCWLSSGEEPTGRSPPWNRSQCARKRLRGLRDPSGSQTKLLGDRIGRLSLAPTRRAI